MAIARIALSRANWRDATGAMIYENVAVLGAADGTLTVRQNGQVLTQVTVVETSRPNLPDEWLITTDTGDRFIVQISRKSGCGCGR